MAFPARAWSDSFETTSAPATLAHGAYAGAIGASAVALVFLGWDAALRTALWTPSLLGGLLLGQASVAQPGPIDLVAVATWSLAHGALFLGFGAGVALLAAALPRVPSFAWLAVGCFVALEVGAHLLAATFAPGLAAAVGPIRVAAGNACAAVAMAAWLRDRVPVFGGR